MAMMWKNGVWASVTEHESAEWERLATGAATWTFILLFLSSWGVGVHYLPGWVGHVAGIGVGLVIGAIASALCYLLIKPITYLVVMATFAAMCYGIYYAANHG